MKEWTVVVKLLYTIRLCDVQDDDKKGRMTTRSDGEKPQNWSGLKSLICYLRLLGVIRSLMSLLPCLVCDAFHLLCPLLIRTYQQSQLCWPGGWYCWNGNLQLHLPMQAGSERCFIVIKLAKKNMLTLSGAATTFDKTWNPFLSYVNNTRCQISLV